MSAIRDFLQQRLGAGEWGIGQILVRRGIFLCHIADDGRTDLEPFARPEDARELAKYDDAGNYRPLKTAPNLRHGWSLSLSGIDELRLALDLLYPAALGNWLAYERGGLAGVPFRETLDRQTGMYRVTQLITDEQADEVIRKTCDPQTGCLRHQLWEISPGRPSPVTRRPTPAASAALPVLCVEACNLLVAACRPVARQNLPKVEPRP